MFFFHSQFVLHGMPGATLRGTFSAAASGVSFFFILSGFVLAWSWRPQRKRNFWQDRFARIWPSHAVAWVVATLAVAPLAFRVATIRTLLGAPSMLTLVLVQAWIPSRRWYAAGNAVSWSLSCEAFFYLCFPVVIVVVARARRPWLLLGGAVATSFAVAAVGTSMSSSLGLWWGYYFPLARLPEFVAGVVLARLVGDGRWPRLPLGPVLAIAAAAVFCARWLPYDLLYVVGPLIPLGALVATAAGAELGGGARRLRHPWLIRLGEISFAFYLLHSSVISEGVKRLAWTSRDGVSDSLVAGLFLVAAMAAAWLLNVAVERPMQRLLRARPRTLRQPTGVDTEATVPTGTPPARSTEDTPGPLP